MNGVSGLYGSNNGQMLGRHWTVPPGFSLKGRSACLWIAPLLTIGAMLIPANLLNEPAMIAATAAALLVGGLPHGALDLALLRQAAQGRLTFVLSLYLGLSGFMFGLWQVAPPLALGLFLAMAMAHFAEDWSSAEHPFFALAIAVALVAAPALLHHPEVSSLFTLLTGTPAATVLADVLLLVAPVASACAMLAIRLLWQGGHRSAAINAGCALAAMTLLPPVIGFAIYFCLIHSPAHFRAGLARLNPAPAVARLTIAATLGGLAIGFVAIQFLPTVDLSARIFAASFMTLSVLTLPHLAMPMILSRPVTSAPRR